MRKQVKVSGTNGLGLNIRSGPGTGFNKIGLLEENGWLFTVDGQENGWYKLANRKGYVSSKFVKVVKDLEGDKHYVFPTEGAPIFFTERDNQNLPKPEKSDITPDNIPKKNTKGFFSVEGIPDENKTLGLVLPKVDNPLVDPYQDITNYIRTPDYIPGNGHDLFTDYDFIKNSMGNIEYNQNRINDPRNVYGSIREQFYRFNRFKVPFPDLELSKTFGYVFFLRPNLNLFEVGTNTLRDEISGDPYYWYLFKSQPEVLYSLTLNALTTSHDFFPFLCNKSMTFEVQDEYIKSEDDGETFTGFKMKYGKSDIESKISGNFTMTFQEDGRLTILQTMKAWVTYISKVYRGEFHSDPNYTIYDKILDYASGVYYFLCGSDGETILFWTKYYGVYPTTIPSNTLSYSKGSFVKTPEINVNFDYSMKEDMNPIAIHEFNTNSRRGYVYKSMYERELASTGHSMSGEPFIETHSAHGDYRLKLKFRP